MDSASIVFCPIGVIRTQHREPDSTPIQPAFAEDCEGRVEVFPAFIEGLSDLDGFSHVMLIYYWHQAGAPQLKVKPYLQDIERGVFATRKPCRPNPIGLSIVELIGVDKGALSFRGADMLDETPLLDIKPYIARFDCVQSTRDGWQGEVDEQTAAQRGRRETNTRGHPS